MKGNHDLQNRLDSALAEIERLRNENRALQKALSLSIKPSPKSDARQCRRPRKECEKLGERLYFPLTDQVIHGHLTGKYEVGIYPLLEDDKCCFLAIDFDKRTWPDDVTAFCKHVLRRESPHIPSDPGPVQERIYGSFLISPCRQGKPELWEPLLLSSASNKRFEIGLDSFDRMFPNQDLLPKGGFGNLIALPLQKKARESGNSVFLDDSLQQVRDQWRYFSNIRKVSEEQLEDYLKKLSYETQRCFEPDDQTAESDFLQSHSAGEDRLLPDRDRTGTNRVRTIRIRFGNMLRLDTEDLSSGLIRLLISCASFSNPEFYRAQKLRLSVYGKPRIISCAEISKNHIELPRGRLDAVREKLRLMTDDSTENRSILRFKVS